MFFLLLFFQKKLKYNLLGNIQVAWETQTRNQTSLVHTNLNDAVDQRLHGCLDVTLTSEHKKCVLEISCRSAVGVCPTQNYVVMSVQVSVLLLQCLKNLKTEKFVQEL